MLFANIAKTSGKNVLFGVIRRQRTSTVNSRTICTLGLPFEGRFLV